MFVGVGANRPLGRAVRDCLMPSFKSPPLCGEDLKQLEFYSPLYNLSRG